jgi:hypothetical protein
VTPGFLNVACIIGRRAIHEMNAAIVLAATTICGCLLVSLVMAFAADRYFCNEARRRIAQYRATRAKTAHASPFGFRAADEAHVHATFEASTDQHRDRVLKNHRALMEDEYPGDIDFSPVLVPQHATRHDKGRSSEGTAVNWWLDMDMGEDVTDMVPLETLVAGTVPEEEAGQDLALPSSNIIRPSILSRVVNLMMVSLVVTTFLMYPTVVQAAVRVVQCETLLTGVDATPTISVVSYDPAMSCTSPEYAADQGKAYTVLAVCGLCIPVLCPLLIVAAAVFTCENSLLGAKQLFFFVTGGYRVWYWESVVLARKAALVVTVGFVSDIEVSAVATMWILAASLALNVALRPWESRQLGNLEAASLGSLTFSSILLAALAADRNPNTVLLLLIVVCVMAVNFAVVILFIETFIITLHDEVQLGSELDRALNTQSNAIHELRTLRQQLWEAHRHVHRRSMRLHGFVEMETALAIRRRQRAAESAKRAVADAYRECEALKISDREEQAALKALTTPTIVDTNSVADGNGTDTVAFNDHSVYLMTESPSAGSKRRSSSSSSSAASVEIDTHPDETPAYWAKWIQNDVGDGSPPPSWWEDQHGRQSTRGGVLASAADAVRSHIARQQSNASDTIASMFRRRSSSGPSTPVMVVTDLTVELAAAEDGEKQATSSSTESSVKGTTMARHASGDVLFAVSRTQSMLRPALRTSVGATPRNNPTVIIVDDDTQSGNASCNTRPLFRLVGTPTTPLLEANTHFNASSLRTSIVGVPPALPTGTATSLSGGLEDPLLINFMNVPEEFLSSSASSSATSDPADLYGGT